MIIRHAFLILSLILPTPAQEAVTRLACGSCYKPKNDRGIWKTIAADQPQIFLFMGDNVYADTNDPEEIAEEYEKLNEQPDYAAFSRKIPILPIWDDHDYGQNDAGREFPQKEESARLFFDAFSFPADHPARQTPGVYHSRIFGPAGKRLQVIMLDTRYFRSPLVQVKKDGRKTYLPQTGPDATMLGPAQWDWLASQLKKPADLRLIVSSIQIIATDHRFEKWANLPEERARLFKLLGGPGVGPVLLLSGDRHCAEVARLPAAEIGTPYDLYEMTSSGMTHAGAPDDPSPTRVDGTFTRKKNYGLIEIAWQDPEPRVLLRIKSTDGKTLSTTKISF